MTGCYLPTTVGNTDPKVMIRNDYFLVYMSSLLFLLAMLSLIRGRRKVKHAQLHVGSAAALGARG